MKEDLKKTFDRHRHQEGFIKVTDFPVTSLTSEQKVVLNRKGNALFNSGDIFSARRLFITTGYSDGLSRVAQKSEEKEDYLDALKLYWLAHNKKKAETLIEKIALVISQIYMKEE
ncbi:MAG: hypothetical protein K5930_13805 [Treponemataceae bacterium]|nr:hypothetical protein [Treponemataceae bacterium]